MDERERLTRLPGTLALGWRLLMRPVSLHHELAALGIDPQAGWRGLWRGDGIERAYLVRDGWLAETRAEAEGELDNPFHAGLPLDPQAGSKLFRGREPLVARIQTLLGGAGRGAAMALIGLRRSGKTSLLKMLPQQLSETQVVFFDAQNQARESVRALAQALVEQTRDDAWRDRALALPATTCPCFSCAPAGTAPPSAR